mgnify:CR=1 FL=1
MTPRGFGAVKKSGANAALFFIPIAIRAEDQSPFALRTSCSFGPMMRLYASTPG